MLRCRDIVRHGDAFLSGEMRGWKRAGFWVHLLFCRYCRRYIRQLRTTQAVSISLPPSAAASDAEVDAVLACIAADAVEKDRGRD
ncbi:MAG: hypothetical protein Q7T36_04820 [Fluviicoccus sp.]|uniref:hypothetical protein n=1 Tax=Fluviicoccus sp. TaxID=2003552 RepID=UPI0027198408|nr:hypothetical protein [Fluviicoccus sp.]MDO8329776.1 hypothetical protein [Fluviicoccus sp.]